MAKGVLVKIDGVIKEKRVYDGDNSRLDEDLLAEGARDRSKTFVVFEDAADDGFVSAVVPKDVSRLPDLQTQLDAFWTDGPVGGPVTEAMRARMRQPRTGPPPPAAPPIR